MKSRKALKRIVLVAVIVVAAVAAVMWWRRGQPATEASIETTTTAQAKRAAIREAVQSNGKVVSNLDVEIKCRASGEIVKLPFDVSANVKKGDLLLELDPVDQERQVQQAEAGLAASKAQLAQAEASLATAERTLIADRMKSQAALESAQARATDASAKAKREEQLLEKKYSSAEGLETAKTTATEATQSVASAKAQMEAIKAQELDLETKRQQINLAKAEVESDTIALSLAQRQLKYTSVFAPIDGVVAQRAVQIGQIISSGISNVGGGTTVMVLSDLSRVYILASVDESDIGSIALGQKVDITADSFPRKRFHGSVDRIATKGVNLSNVVTFEVRIEVLSDNKGLLKPEMTANVSIIIADKEDVLTVPSTAIVRDKADTYVALAKADGTEGERKPVQIGISDGVNTEIVSGIDEGTTVVVRKPEDESRWRSGGDQSGNRQRMMMMRTMGGGGGGGGRGR